ncbi:hypothetical protein B0H17DRAFT_1134248 [Mycena rosella]|uniref:Uncharacterized protein n=1 Tax=Mycena rosella TaxID=1033263 RepID=A0AAD7GEH8_MYCRO|nr:hypothetical protein B0H17DRAFT_1134248 [Mycena rosella]
MDPILTDRFGNELVYIWCSINAPSSNIPTCAYSYYLDPPLLLESGLSEETLTELDFTKRACRYTMKEHYLGWMPIGGPRTSALSGNEEDPIDLLFNTEDIILAGYTLDSSWVEPIVEMAEWLHRCCLTMVQSSNFYSQRWWSGAMGDIPPTLNVTHVSTIQEGYVRAQEVARAAKRTVLTMAGFALWLLSIKELETLGLLPQDQEYICSLRLGEHPKARVLYNLSQDYHEANFLHLAQHDVLIHYQGGNVDPSLLPSYELWRPMLKHYDWMFQDLKAGRVGYRLTNPNPVTQFCMVDCHLYGARPLTHWPTIHTYAERFQAIQSETLLGTVGMFFCQNPLAIDEPLSVRVQPTEHEFSLTDFTFTTVGEDISKADTFYDSTLRAREMAKNKWAPRTRCTFNLFNGSLNEPLPPPRTPSAISGHRADPARGNEGLSTQWSQQMASGSGCTQNLCSLSSPHRNEPSGGDRNRSLSPAALRTSDSDNGKYIDRALDNYHQEEDFPNPDSFESMGGWDVAMLEEPRAESVPLFRASPTARSEYRLRELFLVFPDIPDWDSALGVIVGHTHRISELEPRLPPFDVSQPWNTRWLGCGVLVCSDRHTLLWMKAYCKEWFPYFRSYDYHHSYQPTAIMPPPSLSSSLSEKPYLSSISRKRHWALGDPHKHYTLKSSPKRQATWPFGLGFPLRSTSAWRMLKLLPALAWKPWTQTCWTHSMPPTYVDTLLTYGQGGKATYLSYCAQLNYLLKHPHARAFIAKGGVLCWLAELYNLGLVGKFLSGPSVQVTEYQKGKMMLLTQGGHNVFYMVDYPSSSKDSMLLGHIPAKHANKEAWLWPPPSLIEKGSKHMRGYLSSGVIDILNNLRCRDGNINVMWFVVIGNCIALSAVLYSAVTYPQCNATGNDAFPQIRRQITN